MDKVEIILEPEDNNRLLNLCGPLNNNLKELELRFDVEINQRGNLFYFAGNKKNIFIASETLKELYVEAGKKDISIDLLHDFLDQPNILKNNKRDPSNNGTGNLKYKNYVINISSNSQRNFVEAISKNDLVFSIGAAGSGKTVLAIGAA